jgi:hypothetical protein
MRTAFVLMILGLLGGPGASSAHAQKGMGEETGVARQATRPPTILLKGRVLTTKIGPCEQTTGAAEIGAHFMLKTAGDETLNIHLGPITAVAKIVEELREGRAVTVVAFRTSRMPGGHFVARSLTFEDRTIELRDASLRPLWARGNDSSRARRESPRGRGGMNRGGMNRGKVNRSRGNRGRGHGGGRGRGGRGRGAPRSGDRGFTPIPARRRSGQL